MQDLKVLHIPWNVPYIKGLHFPGNFVSVNTFDTPTFAWIVSQNDQLFWNTFDVCHIHFGFEFEDIEVVEEALKTLARHGKAMVFTIHEISSVHGVGLEKYRQYVNLILGYSAIVITLTESAKNASREIFTPTGDIVVIPHGRVACVSKDVWHTISRPHRQKVLLCGALRSNREMTASFINLALSTEGRHTVSLVTRPFTPEQLRDDEVLRLAVGLAGNKCVTVRTILPLPDEEMVNIFLDADVLVLPYKSAGHSGQLELAFDCGLPVVASNVGFLSDQCSAWPEEEKASTFFIDWSDGKYWQYQQRLVAVIDDALQFARLNERRKAIERRQDYRSREHMQILHAHANIYKEAVLKLSGGG